MSNLIIVESPAKARTISNFLNKDYTVVASKGHIRDLPKSSFGITIETDGTFVPKYTIPRKASATVRELKKLAKDADIIYIATDEDREGEAIGYHIAKAIGKNPENLPRIVFHEITRNAIAHALEHPRRLNMESIDAQQTRRLLDRIVGYKLSPLLSSKIQRGLSAGRVQSATLKIVVDREREIQIFKPEEYWSIDALFDRQIEAGIYRFDEKKIEKMTLKTAEEAQRIAEAARQEDFIVSSIKTAQRKSKTPPPFMTSTLQQTASTQLGFSPKKTMMIAQKLYEGVKTNRGTMGVITYMRTDSFNLAKEAVETVREHILSAHGKSYLPPKPNVYASKARGAQEAHEAIRPTQIDFTPEKAAAYLASDELRLYRLIYNRFVACQMTEARFETQTLLVSGNRTVFKATGRTLLFDGFYRATGYHEKDKLLPKLHTGQSVSLSELRPEQHFTEPPPRYNEASLIKKLESLGIGRPSTYAPTVTILQTRKYIEIEKKRIHPTEVAFTVIDVLEKHFSEIVDSNFTSQMEETLDRIAEGKTDWQKVLTDFYAPFMEKIAKGKQEIKSLKVATPTGEMCPQCGNELLLRKGRYGEFIACSNFPKCKYTRNLDENGQPETPETSDETCDKCGSPMVIKSGRRGKFLACSAYPKCKNTRSLVPPRELEVPCPECGNKLIERQGRRGTFYGCSDYPNCTFIANAEPVDKACPECGYLMGIKHLKSGDTYVCFKCKHKVKAPS